MTSFWNNRHQLHSKPKYLKVLESMKTKMDKKKLKKEKAKIC
jgi:hypothetical protein